MDSAGTCAVCGSENVAHRQEINGSTLCRCQSCAPHRSDRTRRVEAFVTTAIVAGMPLVAALHLWPGVSLGWDSTGEHFEQVAANAGYDPSHWVVQAHVEFFRLSDILFEWLFTGFSVVILAACVLGVVVYLSGRFGE